MLRVLHISDLHLGRAGAWPLGDYKSEIVDEDHRLTRHDLLRGSLDAISSHLVSHDQHLDAVVISGDISYRGQEDGFKALPELLSHLGEADPGPDRTVVVPGNHDVAWRASDAAERYKHFLGHIRVTGYRTPLLEGIDIAAGTGTDIGQAHDPLLDLGDAILIPVNSSNYCGTLQPLGPLADDDFSALEARAMTDPPLGELLKRFDALRLVDVCKISKGQTEALSNRLRAVEANGIPRLKVAVLHHHLLPVNVEEEMKPFETMVNLGFFRHWLASSGVQLVLHGHKHASEAYLDLPGVSPILEPGQHLGAGLVMVSSVATANEERPAEIARLVELGTPGATARSISIHSVPPTYPRLEPAAQSKVAELLVSLAPRHARLRTFEGDTFDAVYHQLVAAFPKDSFEPRYDVVCRVADGATAMRLPTGYPVPDGEDAQVWFDETVAWWQNPEPQLVSPQFNHGERIWRAPHSVDQFALAIDQLRKPGTSRAIMLLVDPQAGQQALYPALCLVQMRIPAGTNQVECVGYFRKQQMRAWWPINVGELAHLQNLAISRLGGYVAGAIVTVSAVAIGGSDRPRVAVPRIDRWSQDNPGALWDLAMATLNPGHPHRSTAIATWSSLFDDWRPGQTMELDGVPLALRGIQALADAIETCAVSFPDRQAAALVVDLRDLAAMTRMYWRDDAESTDDAFRHVRYERWQPLADHAIGRVLKRVAEILRPGAAVESF